jgi:hypothetical protein
MSLIWQYAPHDGSSERDFILLIFIVSEWVIIFWITRKQKSKFKNWFWQRLNIFWNWWRHCIQGKKVFWNDGSQLPLYITNDRLESNMAGFWKPTEICNISNAFLRWVGNKKQKNSVADFRNNSPTNSL